MSDDIKPGLWFFCYTTISSFNPDVVHVREKIISFGQQLFKCDMWISGLNKMEFHTLLLDLDDLPDPNAEWYKRGAVIKIVSEQEAIDFLVETTLVL